MNHKIKIACTLAIIGTIALAETAFAGGDLWPRPGWGQIRLGLQACGQDVARLCPGVMPGGGRVRGCLAAKRDQLSPRCYRFISRALAARNVILACNADAARLCDDVVPGGGRIAACLDDNLHAVSPGCRTWIHRARRAAGRPY